MATGYPGGLNTYVPTLELSGNLMVSFSRNVKKYPVNRYCTITPVKQPRGAYLYFNPLDQVRLPGQPHGNKWAAATLRPTGLQNTLGFEQKNYTTQRYSFDTTLDQRAVDIANWDVQKTHSEALAQKAMTHRAYQVCRVATTQSLYPSAHVVTATSLAGGVLSGGTTADPRILTAFTQASLLIQRDTGGRVAQGEISALMNADTATRLSRTRELREYVMQSPDAMKMIRMDKANANRTYGLPEVLYTTPIVVEDQFYDPYNRGNASDGTTAVFPDNTILMFVRQGDLESSEGAASYSTLHTFMYEDMSVEAYPDVRNRLLQLDVTDEFTPEVVAPVTAVLITNVFN